MSLEDLECRIQEAIADGGVPFFVCATAGTTVLGAFDPINDIADICEKHGLWLHVDVSQMESHVGMTSNSVID